MQIDEQRLEFDKPLDQSLTGFDKPDFDRQNFDK